MLRKMTPDPARVVLIPANGDAVELGVGKSHEPGRLDASLTVTTADLGQFMIPLTAHHLGVLAAVSKKLLNLTAEQVQAIRDDLTPDERTGNA